MGTKDCPFGEVALFIDFNITKIEYLTGLGNYQNIQKPMTLQIYKNTHVVSETYIQNKITGVWVGK